VVIKTKDKISSYIVFGGTFLSIVTPPAIIAKDYDAASALATISLYSGVVN